MPALKRAEEKVAQPGKCWGARRRLAVPPLGSRLQNTPKGRPQMPQAAPGAPSARSGRGTQPARAGGGLRNLTAKSR